MPKQTPTIFKKLRIAYWLMTNQLNCGIIQECGVCGSIKIVGVKAKGRKRISRAKYKCLNCGSVANAKEKWRVSK